MFGQRNCSASAFEEEALCEEVFADADPDAFVEAILINAQLYSEMGCFIHLNHGVNPDGSCTCKSGPNCTDPGKHPRRKNWQKLATRDVNQIRDWLKERPNSNLGICTGSGLVVVDVDARDGGFDTLAKLESRFGTLPREHVVRTGGGGLHIYLAVKAVDAYRIASMSGTETESIGPGVDIKCRGGQVIAASSRHKSGGSYRWQTLTPGPLSPLPEAWVRSLIEISPEPMFPAPIPRLKSGRRRKRRKPQRSRWTGQEAKGVAGAICSITGAAPGDDVVGRVGYCLIRCQVTGSGMTNNNIYRLACGLRNIPELADKSAEDLEPLIKFWFEVGKSNMSKSSWGPVWRRWVYTWNEWSQSQVGPAWNAIRRIVTDAFLADAEASDHKAKFILKGLLNDMQKYASDGRFFLDCRTAKDVLDHLGIEVHHTTVNRWMAALRTEGFLHLLNYRDPDSPATYWYQTAEAAACCDQLDRARNQSSIQISEPVPPTPITTPTKHPIAIAAVLEYNREAPVFTTPDPFAPSSSIGSWLLIDFSSCWTTQPIHDPLASLSFSSN